MQLAQNSFNVKKYSRAADNCRLAANFAMAQNNTRGAAESYQLWIKSLLNLGKPADVKKVCCDARSKFGNHPDLVYYEYLSALDIGDKIIAAKLAREYIELTKEIVINENSIFVDNIDKLDEVISNLNNIRTEKIPVSQSQEMEH